MILVSTIQVNTRIIDRFLAKEEGCGPLIITRPEPGRRSEMSDHIADVIECPHCKGKVLNIHDYLEVGDEAGEFEMKCESCKKPFKVDFYSVFYFATEKI